MTWHKLMGLHRTVSGVLPSLTLSPSICRWACTATLYLANAILDHGQKLEILTPADHFCGMRPHIVLGDGVCESSNAEYPCKKYLFTVADH